MFEHFEEETKKYNTGNSNWFKPQEGDNRVRLVSDFKVYGTHYIPAEKKSYVCIGKEKGCPYCAKGLRPRVQYLGYVIDRTDGQIKLYQMPYIVAKAIHSFQQSEDYSFGDLPPYDINIHKEGTGQDTKYTVIPARKDTPLTADEQNDILETVSKNPPEVVLEKMKEKITPVTDSKTKDDNLPTLEQGEEADTSSDTDNENDENVDVNNIPF